MIDFQYDCQASKNIKNIFLLSAIISYHRNAKEAKTFPSDWNVPFNKNKLFLFGAYANESNILLPKINVGKASLLPNNLEVWALTDTQQLRIESIFGRH